MRTVTKKCRSYSILSIIMTRFSLIFNKYVENVSHIDSLNPLRPTLRPMFEFVAQPRKAPKSTTQ